MESSLTNAVPESPAEKGLTAEEEKDLDTIMQSLDIDSSGSDIDENEDLGARDFTEEFGLSPVSFDHSSHQNVLIPTNPHSTLPTNTSKTTIAILLERLHLQSTHRLAHTALRLLLTHLPYTYRIQSHLQQLRMALLQLLGVRLLRDQVRHVLLLRHLQRRRQCRNRLRHEEHRIALQTRHRADQRDWLELPYTPTYLSPSADPDPRSSPPSVPASSPPPRRTHSPPSDSGPCSTLTHLPHTHLPQLALRVRVAAENRRIGLILQTTRHLRHQIRETLLHKQTTELQHTMVLRMLPLRRHHRTQLVERTVADRLLHHSTVRYLSSHHSISYHPRSQESTDPIHAHARLSYHLDCTTQSKAALPSTPHYPHIFIPSSYLNTSASFTRGSTVTKRTPVNAQA